MVKRVAKSQAAGSPAKVHKSLVQIVNQALNDNFKGWDPELIDVKKVDGKTLRSRISGDKETFIKAGGKSMKFGSTYYTGLKTQYRSATDPMTLLACKNPELVVEERLMSAVVKCYKAKPDRTDVQSYCQTTRHSPNEKEACGIMSLLMTMKCACKKQMPIALDIVRYLHRLDIKTKFPERYKIVEDRIDLVMSTCWGRQSRDLKMDRLSFLRLHYKSLTLLMPVADLEKVLNCGGDYSLVKESVTTITTACRTGAGMFGDIAAQIIAEEVAAEVTKSLTEACKQPWSEDRLRTVREEIVGRIALMQGVELLPPSRIVTWTYMGTVLSKTITSLEQEVAFKAACCWKASAVIFKQLKPLWVEDCF